jgi:hypothetical protein
LAKWWKFRYSGENFAIAEISAMAMYGEAMARFFAGAMAKFFRHSEVLEGKTHRRFSPRAKDSAIAVSAIALFFRYSSSTRKKKVFLIL